MIDEQIISNMYSIFPLIYNNRVIEMLSTEDIKEYTEIIMSNDYNSYIDYKFNLNFSKEDLEKLMFYRVIHYSIVEGNIGEYRLLLKNRDNNKIMGTCTLFFDNNRGLSVGYYLLDCYRGQGEAYNMMSNIIDSIILSEMPVKYIYGVVHQNNKKSLDLLKFLKFKKHSVHKGIYCDNIEFRRELYES